MARWAGFLSSLLLVLLLVVGAVVAEAQAEAAADANAAAAEAEAKPAEPEIKISSSAVISGRDINPGESVSVGTEFTFKVSLDNAAQAGSSIVFSVLDSSSAVIHTTTVDAKESDHSFSYSLTSAALPGGDLTFRFDLKAASGVLASSSVVYNLALPMVATKITFNGAAGKAASVFKIGDKVSVAMEPAGFPDLRSTHVIDVKPAGTSNSRNMQFVMEVTSPGGVLIQTIPGTLDAKSPTAKYVFPTTIAAAISNLGLNVVSFKYLAASGSVQKLSNYDSTVSELFEDDSAVNFTVNAKLVITKIENQPTQADFFYGNEIKFLFEVKDSVTGKSVQGSSQEIGQAGIVMLLKHKETYGRSTSAKESATVATDAAGNAKGFSIAWTINPNSVRGEGSLSLSAVDPDGNAIALVTEAGKPVQYEVNISGEIVPESVTYSVSGRDAPESVFVVEFRLFCQGKILLDAQLRASAQLQAENASVINLPVASNASGTYQVSWTTKHQNAPSGAYLLQFFRETDRLRSLESAEFAAKQAKDNKRRGDTKAVAAAFELTPLFEVTINHTQDSAIKHYVRGQFVAWSLLVGLFVALVYRKASLEK